MFPGETPTPRPYCDIPLGVANPNVVSESQLSASTSFNFSFEATRGRLNAVADMNGAGAWIPRYCILNTILRKFYLRKILVIFLPIDLNMCFGCSKEPSHRDGSFKYPQHMFWLRNNENNFPIHTFIWRPVQ